MIDRKAEIPVRNLTDINFGNVAKQTMPNGIPLTICHSDTEDVVRIDIVFKGGRWQQDYMLQALFTNRLLKEGTRDMSAEEIAETLDYYGAWLDLGVSHTRSYVTMYTLGKYFPQTIELLEKIVKEPSFEEDKLRTIAQINKQNYMVSRTKVDFIAQKSILKQMYGEDNPAAYYATDADFDNISTGMLADFHRKYYQSANCDILLSGNVTDKVIALAEKHFGNTPFGENRHEFVTTLYPVRSADESKYVFTEVKHATQSSLRMACFIPERNHEDYNKVQILITLFGGYFGSRLMSNIREQKGYTYGISANMVFSPGTGAMLISTEADAEYCSSIIEETKLEMERLRNETVPAEELDNVKNYMSGELARSFEGAFSIADSQVFLHSSDLTMDFYHKTVEALHTITPADITDTAQKYFDSNSLKISLAGKSI